MQGDAVSDSDEWLTKRQAAAYLKVSVPTLDRWMRIGRVRFYKVGEGRLARVQFRQSDLDAQRREGRPGRGAGPEPEPERHPEAGAAA
jgi:excisionase family DNA binding protein